MGIQNICESSSILKIMFVLVGGSSDSVYVNISQHNSLRAKLLGSVSGVATIETTKAAASVKNAHQFRLSRPEFWHPEYSTQMFLCSITVPHIVESMAVVLSRPEPMVTQSWTTFQLLEFVYRKRSRYSNRAVNVIYSNRAFNVNYNQYSLSLLGLNHLHC